MSISDDIGSSTHWIIRPQELDNVANCSYHSIAAELLEAKPHSVHKLGEPGAALCVSTCEKKNRHFVSIIVEA